MDDVLRNSRPIWNGQSNDLVIWYNGTNWNHGNKEMTVVYNSAISKNGTICPPSGNWTNYGVNNHVPIEVMSCK